MSTVETCVSRSTVATLASRPEAAVAIDPGPHLSAPNGKSVDSPRRRSSEEAVLGGFTGKALHRGAGAHPSRVPADDVKARPHRGREVIDDGRQECRSPDAWPAGLIEERADAPLRVARAVTNPGDLDLALARMLVVERHADRDALKTSLDGIWSICATGPRPRLRRSRTTRARGRPHLRPAQ